MRNIKKNILIWMICSLFVCISISGSTQILAGESVSQEKQTLYEKENSLAEQEVEPVLVELEDGEYSVEVTMTGGSGKAFVASPTLLIVEDGKAYANLTWSSSNYDYMLVGTKKYYNQSEEGVNSAFLIPIAGFDEEMPVVADTLAMGTPREIQYRLVFYGESIGSKGQLPQEAAKRVVIVAFIIIIGGGILDHYIKKRRNY